MKAGLVVAAVLAAVWVVLPLFSKSAPSFVRSAPATAAVPEAHELKGRAPSPIRYAYGAKCEESSPRCTHWILVSARGDRWWLPYAFSKNDTLAISKDGTRVAYPHEKLGHFVVADLKTGASTVLPVQARYDLAQSPLFSPDGRYLLLQNDHPNKRDEMVRERPMIVDIDRNTVRKLPISTDVRGWTADGLVVATRRASDTIPGHVTAFTYAVYSPKGKAVGQYSVPSNATGTLSPSGRLIASLPKEVTASSVTGAGVMLVDALTGKPLRTVAGDVSEIVRWESESALVVRTGEGYGVLDLATGRFRLTVAAGESVVIGAVQGGAGAS